MFPKVSVLLIGICLDYSCFPLYLYQKSREIKKYSSQKNCDMTFCLWIALSDPPKQKSQERGKYTKTCGLALEVFSVALSDLPTLTPSPISSVGCRPIYLVQLHHHQHQHHQQQQHHDHDHDHLHHHHQHHHHSCPSTISKARWDANYLVESSSWSLPQKCVYRQNVINFATKLHHFL